MGLNSTMFMLKYNNHLNFRMRDHRDFPQTVENARQLGWIKGAEYDSMFDPITGGRRVQIQDWCVERFNYKDFRCFSRSVWFRNEADAILCKLRWS